MTNFYCHFKVYGYKSIIICGFETFFEIKTYRLFQLTKERSGEYVKLIRVNRDVLQHISMDGFPREIDCCLLCLGTHARTLGTENPVRTSTSFPDLYPERRKFVRSSSRSSLASMESLPDKSST